MKNKNTGFKHLVLLFAFILCLFSCVSAKAANYYYEDGYKYTLSLGKATIISYVGSDTDLTVPSILNGKPVVKIESSAFANNKNLCSVILPDTITSMGISVFAQCENLKSIHYPEGLDRIYYRTFAGCHNLTKVNISSNIKIIEDSAFAGCTSLTYLDLPKVKEIGEYSFANCTSLSEVICHKGFTYVGSASFKNCTNLKDVTLPLGTQTISYSAFEGCKALRHIDFPSTLVFLKSASFKDTGLVHIIVPPSVTHEEQSVFLNCKNLEEAEYHGKVIEGFTFANCTNLKKLIIGPEVTYIGSSVFDGTTQLETLQIPATTNLHSRVFIGAEALHTIYGVKNSPVEIAANNAGLNFVPVKDHSIKLNKKQLTLYTVKGKNSAVLKSVISGSTSTPTWNSSNTKVVQVNATGKVTAKGAGTAYVTVTLGNKSASCKITVKKPVLNLKNKAITLKKGSSYTISCSAVPTGKITYKSSNTKCVTVNTKGKITARQKGTATVSIKCNGITQKLKVTVK